MLEDSAEILIDDIENCCEAGAALIFKLVGETDQLVSPRPEFLCILSEVSTALHCFVVLLDGSHVDIAEVVDLALECSDNRFDVLDSWKGVVTLGRPDLEKLHLLCEFLECASPLLYLQVEVVDSLAGCLPFAPLLLQSGAQGCSVLAEVEALVIQLPVLLGDL